MAFQASALPVSFFFGSLNNHCVEEGDEEEVMDVC